MQKANIQNGKKSTNNNSCATTQKNIGLPNFCADMWQVDADYLDEDYQSENLADQDDIDFDDEQIEDVARLMDEEYFDFLEQEKQKQKIQKIIDKVTGEK